MKIGGRIQPTSPLETLASLRDRIYQSATTASELYALTSSGISCRTTDKEYDVSRYPLVIAKCAVNLDGSRLIIGEQGLILDGGVLANGIVERRTGTGTVTITGNSPSRLTMMEISGASGNILVVRGDVLVVGCVIGGDIRVTETGRMAIVGSIINGTITVDTGGVVASAGNL